MDELAADLNRLVKALDSGSSPSYDELTMVRHRADRRATWIAAGVVVVLLALLVLLGATHALLGV